VNAVYLDHAATTPVRPEVLEAMMPFFADTFGNASSIHAFGQKARKALEDAREVVAASIGAEASEIHFTSGGTESDNLAIKGIAQAAKKKGRHLITSRVEHHAVLSCCKQLEREGFEVTYQPVDRFGTVDLDALEKAIRPDTILVSLMLANNVTGTLQPVAEAAVITKRMGVPIHTDAVQAVGKVPVNVDELGVDLLSISAHKIYGPKGIGCLYVRKRTRIAPLLHGGHHERRKRPGTENVAAIVGFAKAIGLSKDEMPVAVPRLAGLRDRLETGLRREIPHTHVNGHPKERLPNFLNMSFEFVKGDALLIALDARGIAVSAGSACASGATEPSHVLQAMGVEPDLAHGSLRFSLGDGITEDEIDFAVESLAEIVQRIRKRSPAYTEKIAV